MPDDRCRLGSDDVVIGLDLASAEHQVVVLTAAGQRLTRFRIPHSRAGLEELLRRTTPAALGRAGGARVFAFEATGHVWEAVAYVLRARGEPYVVVNPLATFRVREARQLSREKTDLTDAEQIAELCRTGLVTRTQLEARPYLALRRAWGSIDGSGRSGRDSGSWSPINSTDSSPSSSASGRICCSRGPWPSCGPA